VGIAEPSLPADRSALTHRGSFWIASDVSNLRRSAIRCVRRSMRPTFAGKSASPAKAGESPYNVAVAIARLGCAASWPRKLRKEKQLISITVFVTSRICNRAKHSTPHPHLLWNPNRTGHPTPIVPRNSSTLQSLQPRPDPFSRRHHRPYTPTRSLLWTLSSPRYFIFSPPPPLPMPVNLPIDATTIRTQSFQAPSQRNIYKALFNPHLPPALRTAPLVRTPTTSGLW